MKVFNNCTVKVHLDRAKNGKKFGDLFMQRMKDKYKRRRRLPTTKMEWRRLHPMKTGMPSFSVTSILNRRWSDIKQTIMMIATTRMIATAMRLLP